MFASAGVLSCYAKDASAVASTVAGAAAVVDALAVIDAGVGSRCVNERHLELAGRPVAATSTAVDRRL
eukprot:363276-Chlamydomonas_euryale.AAC.3